MTSPPGFFAGLLIRRRAANRQGRWPPSHKCLGAPVFVDENRIWLPSRDQTGFKSSAESNVSLEAVPRFKSRIQRLRLPAADSRIPTATRVPSGERAGLLYRAACPTVPSFFPLRSNHWSCSAACAEVPAVYARTPLAEAEKSSTPSAMGTASPVTARRWASNDWATSVPARK